VANILPHSERYVKIVSTLLIHTTSDLDELEIAFLVFGGSGAGGGKPCHVFWHTGIDDVQHLMLMIQRGPPCGPSP
jgi:hypothetical protein